MVIVSPLHKWNNITMMPYVETGNEKETLLLPKVLVTTTPRGYLCPNFHENRQRSWGRLTLMYHDLPWFTLIWPHGFSARTLIRRAHWSLLIPAQQIQQPPRFWAWWPELATLRLTNITMHGSLVCTLRQPHNPHRGWLQCAKFLQLSYGHKQQSHDSRTHVRTAVRESICTSSCEEDLGRLHDLGDISMSIC